jgi:hypothetical protein
MSNPYGPISSQLERRLWPMSDRTVSKDRRLALEAPFGSAFEESFDGPLGRRERQM